MADVSGSRLNELLRGWRVLLGATLGASFAVTSLPFYTSGLFIKALHQEFGWSLAALSLGPALMVAALAFAAPALGYLFDRFGERRFIVPGLLVQIVGLTLLSRSSSLPMYYALLAGMALLGAGCAAPAYVRIVNRHFDLSKGTALAVMITGAALLSALAPPLVQLTITRYGWSQAYLGLALAVGCATPVIYLLLRSAGAADMVRSAPTADAPRDDFRYTDLLRDRTFIVLASAVALVAAACPGLLIHFPAMLATSGVTAQDAAWMVSLIGFTQIGSRLATGVLVDRFFAPRIATLFMATSAGAFLAFWWGGPSWAVAGAIAVGLAYGAEADLLGYFAGRYYKQQHFSRVFGIFYSVFLIGTALSPGLYGYIVDRSGGYGPALPLAAGCLAAASVLFFLLPRFPAQFTAAPGAESGGAPLAYERT